MKKLIIVSIICVISTMIFGQSYKKYLPIDSVKHEVKIGGGYAFLTKGDHSGFFFFNQYNYNLSKRILLTFDAYFVHSDENGLLSEVPDGFVRNIATGGNSEDGIMILDLKTDQQTYVTGDLGASFRLINNYTSSLSINSGLSVAYINESSIKTK